MEIEGVMLVKVLIRMRNVSLFALSSLVNEINYPSLACSNGSNDCLIVSLLFRVWICGHTHYHGPGCSNNPERAHSLAQEVSYHI